ncbi:biotin carboxylase N-terminal domain-containing protein [Sphingomonas sp. CROZ-RG-20F-R02-07]|uniref:acetyl/propionyl/methylcrotonyl-CoA carboxylase subunit alpha n=1 Tax=Sphingomonas sp. CROZ-RG-20F-R02-07 TaxID=2914832 RepID=UPI001F58E1DF|nr:biotin carboxylase N-terminal domain-containing protein [Sphingomonas sp. CROZ-RG-20F-R02-07]
MLKSLLIANRGEIACRIIRTARAMGIRTVAVHSDADADALHVKLADEAVAIGPSPARESYLVGERIIAAALETGAEAIHPGYGFLSENAGFADAVIAAGLIWVGAPPAAIRAMGLKDAAKALMIAADVPVTPGYLGEDQSPDRLRAEADAIGYPVLVKAVAGGGGKGMRRVDAAADFAELLASCRREAAASFGDDRVLIEKYILSPRHIEVQVFGDTQGEVVHLFERDCSLQRRHQKVIEEAPAPGMDAATRAAICAAAVKAARAVDYVGAGTIEFIADASEGLRADRIWFMEMNTRLQVEHPVTEEITGVDLVEWQLRVASGEPLPRRQDELAIRGWAMEARLYAENPLADFLPSTGVLGEFFLDDDLARIETGVGRGSAVSPFYDPMIAKLVVHGVTRDEAREKLALACDTVLTWPVRNNAGFLAALLRHPDFAAASIDTGFIAREGEALTAGAAIGAALLDTAAVEIVRAGGGTRHAADPASDDASGEIWRDLLGLRLNAPRRERVAMLADGMRREGCVGARVPDEGSLLRETADGVLIVDRGWAHLFQPFRASGTAGGAAADGAIVSPMPGRIIAVGVHEGEAVAKGRTLLTLEAMKMEHSLVAPFDGIVSRLSAVVGGQVAEGVVLATIEKETS